MINIVQNNLGVKRVVMQNLLTEERAKEFLEIFESENSRVGLISYQIVDTWKKQ